MFFEEKNSGPLHAARVGRKLKCPARQTHTRASFPGRDFGDFEIFSGSGITDRFRAETNKVQTIGWFAVRLAISQ
ncbi:MAG: hypothetical protein DRH20_01985 [Deltaproteobacteria bacterium]|nr:MAG: hypothetical protein DRH20_01985 [Deltaproteobacteria bacterium]